jgi:hemoglobin
VDNGDDEAAVSLYDAVGGAPWFVALIDHFYDRVMADPLLAPMFPADLTASKRNAAAFLIQYWGGPTTYSDERGHPRLRMRHAPFSIGRSERDAWVGHMRASVEAMAPAPEVETALVEYFEMAATAMINRSETPASARGSVIAIRDSGDGEPASLLFAEDDGEPEHHDDHRQ